MSDEGLLAWQWRLYGDNHTDRGNLVIHLATWPLFVGGVFALLTAPLTTLWMLAIGPAAMLIAIVAQGRGHKREPVAPVPFRGPLDVVRRLFAEQLITFPRYLFSGALARAWRAQKIGSSTRTAG